MQAIQAADDFPSEAFLGAAERGREIEKVGRAARATKHTCRLFGSVLSVRLSASCSKRLLARTMFVLVDPHRAFCSVIPSSLGAFL